MTEKPTLPANYLDARNARPDPLGLMDFDGAGSKKDDTNKPKVSKSVAFVDALIIMVVIFAASGSVAMLLAQWVLNIAELFPKSEDVITRIQYPNPFGFQYVLPDKNRPVIEVEEGRPIPQEFNVGVEMNSKSFSAHSPIKVHAEAKMLRSNVPENWVVFDKMYVIFVGSHNNPIQYTGLGRGYYPGYIEASEQSGDETFLHYKGDGYIQYEMGGQYPVYLSSVRPTIEVYDPTLVSTYPTVNIAAEDATNAVKQAEEAESRERINLAFTLAILAASFAVIRQPIKEIVKDLSKTKPPKPKDR